jgi:hypothetical protein
MLKFPTQMGVEIYATDTGLICFSQESIEYGKQVDVFLTIGQLRALLKNADALIADAEIAKAEYQLGASK